MLKDKTQLNVRISKKKLTLFKTVVKRQGENVSTVLEHIIQQYIKDNDISAYIDDLWHRAGDKMKKHHSLKDIPRIIGEVRRENRN
jgi:hypothetical protein